MEHRNPENSPRNDSEEEPFPLALGDITEYSVGTRLGRGKYSNVFRGHAMDGTLCVIKVLKPVRRSKINREIKILQAMRGAPHVSQLLDVVQDPDSRSVALVLDWSNNVNIRSILGDLTKEDIAIYVHGVLEALAFAHAHGIMHRDVKPGNIMFDLSTRDVHLIDWGLAEYYVPGESYPVRVATRHYKGPELLFGYMTYDCSLDMWSLGCTFASLLFRKLTFFRGHDNDEQIVKLSEIFGSDEIFRYVEKYSLEITQKVANGIEVNGRKKPWSHWVTSENKDLATDDALDLLDRLLKIDHRARITAAEALNHPFFRCLPGPT
jgi:casein kinase II subunit alpha